MAQERMAVSLQTCLGDLWGEDDFSDFSVVVEGNTYRCHRFILAAVSGFFRGLFRSNMKECQDNSVTIEGIDQETFRVVLQSVYRGAGYITLDNFLEVWGAALQLQIEFLNDECNTFAKNNCSTQNCFKVLDFAYTFDLSDLINRALKYMARNFEDLKTTVDMMQLSFADFYNIINSNFLIARKEDVVLETIINWCDYDELSETFNWNTEFGTVDRLVQDGTMNQSAGVGSADYNNNDTTMAFLSMDSFNNQTHGTHFAAEHYQDIESHGKSEGTILDELLNASALAVSPDYFASSAEESSVAASRKRSHSQAGFDDDSDSSVGPRSKVHRSDRSQYLAQLVAACRLCLVSSKYLQQLLETNSTLKSCQETNQMLLRALVYTLDVGQRHDCWPDQAVRRIDGYMSHVMVYWRDTGIEAYDIRKGRVKRIGKLGDARHCSSMHLAVFDNSLYCVFGTGNGRNVTFSSGRFTREEGFKILPSGFDKFARMLAHDNCLYFLARCRDEKTELLNCKVTRDAGAVWESCNFFHVAANCLVRFNRYILVFHTANQVVISECFDTQSRRRTKLASTMDGTSEGMTSFVYRGDVYLVQTNGSLWKITEAGEDHKIEFELVTRLWDNTITILGLAMFQSKLHLFVNKGSVKNATFLDNLPASVPQIVRIPLDATAEMVPMLVPSSWMWDINFF